MSSSVSLDITLDTTPEDDPEPYPYCGSVKSWPRPCFNPYRDVLLETLCFAASAKDIASLCGLVMLHRLLIYPLVAIMEPVLLNGGHQCARRRSQSHLLLGSARLGNGHQRLLILRESMSPPCCILIECHHTRTKGPQRRI